MTPQQTKLYNYIKNYINAHDGLAPSYTEMTEYMNLGSRSGIHRLLTALEESRLIERDHYRSRRIYLVDRNQKVPDNVFWQFLYERGLTLDFIDFKRRSA